MMLSDLVPNQLLDASDDLVIASEVRQVERVPHTLAEGVFQFVGVGVQSSSASQLISLVIEVSTDGFVGVLTGLDGRFVRHASISLA